MPIKSILRRKSTASRPLTLIPSARIEWCRTTNFLSLSLPQALRVSEEYLPIDFLTVDNCTSLGSNIHPRNNHAALVRGRNQFQTPAIQFCLVALAQIKILPTLLSFNGFPADCLHRGRSWSAYLAPSPVA